MQTFGKFDQRRSLFGFKKQFISARFARTVNTLLSPLTMSRKRGQVKMFETVGVLVVFFILLGIGAVVYFSVQSTSLQREAAHAQEQYAFQIVLKSLYFPELDCSFLVTQKDNCIDKIKLEQLSKQIGENEDVKSDYFAEFGYSTVKITEEFPFANAWTLYENIPPDYSDILVTQSPILLYDAWQDTYAFGVIEVSTYVE